MKRDSAHNGHASPLLNRTLRFASTIAGALVLAASANVLAGTIKVTSATYGEQCGAVRGNATRDLARRCDGRKTCQYMLTRVVESERADGCREDFLAEWRCSARESHIAAVSPSAGAGDTLVLSCIPSTGAGK